VDQGYNDYQLFAYWTENRIFFATRLKDNADYTVVEKRSVPTNRNFLADELIRFNGCYAQRRCPHILRKVVAWDKDQNRQIALLTNRLKFGLTTISAINKDNWQIELFFKALKRYLKVKTFVGTTENALFIQIWTAVNAHI
jgi:IS4 transposase